MGYLGVNRGSEAMVDTSELRRVLSQIRTVAVHDTVLPEDHNLQTTALYKIADLLNGMVDTSELRRVLSQIRTVGLGDYIFPEDHNLQTTALYKIADLLDQIVVGIPPVKNIVREEYPVYDYYYSSTSSASSTEDHQIVEVTTPVYYFGNDPSYYPYVQRVLHDVIYYVSCYFAESDYEYWFYLDGQLVDHGYVPSYYQGWYKERVFDELNEQQSSHNAYFRVRVQVKYAYTYVYVYLDHYGYTGSITRGAKYYKFTSSGNLVGISFGHDISETTDIKINGEIVKGFYDSGSGITFLERMAKSGDVIELYSKDVEGVFSIISECIPLYFVF